MASSFSTNSGLYWNATFDPNYTFDFGKGERKEKKEKVVPTLTPEQCEGRILEYVKNYQKNYSCGITIEGFNMCCGTKEIGNWNHVLFNLIDRIKWDVGQEEWKYLNTKSVDMCAFSQKVFKLWVEKGLRNILFNYQDYVALIATTNTSITNKLAAEILKKYGFINVGTRKNIQYIGRPVTLWVYLFRGE